MKNHLKIQYKINPLQKTMAKLISKWIMKKSVPNPLQMLITKIHNKTSITKSIIFLWIINKVNCYVLLRNHRKLVDFDLLQCNIIAWLMTYPNCFQSLFLELLKKLRSTCDPEIPEKLHLAPTVRPVLAFCYSSKSKREKTHVALYR